MIFEDLSSRDFFDLVPTDVVGNIAFRSQFHKLCADSKSLQEWYLQCCRDYLPVMFNTLFCTKDPRRPPGEKNQPFILRPKQVGCVEILDGGIKEGHDLGINKSRDEGASEMVTKTFVAHCLLYNNCNFILGSRNKDLVDDFGNDYTLFAKVDNVFEYLPSWFKVDFSRKDMLLRINTTSSAMCGETTNENFSAGGRATGILLDEIGRVRKSIAESIEGSVHDVTNCVIYNSTHWLGMNHTFNRVIQRPTTKMIYLYWYNNPEKVKGLYESPVPGEITILDEDYYSETGLPKHFKLKDYEGEIEEYGLTFVADGGKRLPPEEACKVRSPWHDLQELKRDTRRDFFCNVWGTPVGSADSVFDPEVLGAIGRKSIREPDYKGEITYECDFQGRVDRGTSVFHPDAGLGRLQWWGPLVNGKPPIGHNFILGVDISWGLGSSNSVISILDRNTLELVGLWVCPNTKPEELADMSVAVASWVGGVDPAFIAWENNGGQGTNFRNRIIWQNYPYVYFQRKEDKTNKRTRKYGWYSTKTAKQSLLQEFGVALAEGIKENSFYRSIKIYSKDLLAELNDYIFQEKGSEAGPSSKTDDGSGARERHGDRVIATALCVLAIPEQRVGEMDNILTPPVTSFMHRYREKMANIDKAKQGRKRYLF